MPVPESLLEAGGRARVELRGVTEFRVVLELYFRFLIELGTDTVAAAAGFLPALLLAAVWGPALAALLFCVVAAAWGVARLGAGAGSWQGADTPAPAAADILSSVSLLSLLPYPFAAPNSQGGSAVLLLIWLGLLRVS